MVLRFYRITETAAPFLVISFFMKKVLIAGGTGLVGKRLSQLLVERNYEVSHLSRKENLDAVFPAYRWNVAEGFADPKAFQGIDYIINLAGTGVADKRWTTERKKSIIDSRVNSTILLKDMIEAMDEPPKAYIAASAIGYYGNRGEELLLENSKPGTNGFLPECVIKWENAIEEIAATGLRTPIIRIGIVLSMQGGALKEMQFPFNFFAGVYFGKGQQWYSWIHLDDLCEMLIMAIENEKINGIYNGVAPYPARNIDLIKAIKKAGNYPAFFIQAPAFAMRLGLGALSAVVLDSAKVSAKKIEAAGFQFKYPNLDPALAHLLNNK